MKFLFALTFLAPFAAFVDAECNNGCSGHGRCTNYKMISKTATSTVSAIEVDTSSTAFGYDTDISKKDSCTCFTRYENGVAVYDWTGADCSLRTCPHGQSWDGAPHAANQHDLQAECSDKGTCDRKTGACKCFPGYTGSACQRSSCPNNCSNRGECLTLKEIAQTRATNTDYAALSGFNYLKIQYDSAWDADRLRGCECDAGFRGADCSLVECPSTTDPMGGDGSEAGRACSGRGTCDYSIGTCKCYKGFFGTRCEHQRANVL